MEDQATYTVDVGTEDDLITYVTDTTRYLKIYWRDRIEFQKQELDVEKSCWFSVETFFLDPEELPKILEAYRNENKKSENNT